MTEPPPPGAFRHQHHDPRGLVERIEAQIRERLEEAVEMAGLKLMVELRARHGLPAPETSSGTDRMEFATVTTALLVHVRDSFHADLGADDRSALEQAEAGQTGERNRLLAGQVLLARRLPDYWQRFETYQAAYAERRLEEPPARSGWLGRLLGS